jgi:hypothetical protein
MPYVSNALPLLACIFVSLKHTLSLFLSSTFIAANPIYTSVSKDTVMQHIQQTSPSQRVLQQHTAPSAADVSITATTVTTEEAAVPTAVLPAEEPLAGAVDATSNTVLTLAASPIKRSTSSATDITTLDSDEDDDDDSDGDGEDDSCNRGYVPDEAVVGAPTASPVTVTTSCSNDGAAAQEDVENNNKLTHVEEVQETSAEKMTSECCSSYDHENVHSVLSRPPGASVAVVGGAVCGE